MSGQDYRISVSDAATLLGISPGAVRQAIVSGRLDARKDGTLYLISEASLRSYRSRVKPRGPTAATPSARSSSPNETISIVNTDRYSMTTAKAAARLGCSRMAVVKAIHTGRIDAQFFGGRYLIDPHSLPLRDPVLTVWFGNCPGASLRIKALLASDGHAGGLEQTKVTKLVGGGKVVEATLHRFHRLALAFSEKRVPGQPTNRMLVIEPADQSQTLMFDEHFGLAGHFVVMDEVRRPKQAAELFRSFKPE